MPRNTNILKNHLQTSHDTTITFDKIFDEGTREIHRKQILPVYYEGVEQLTAITGVSEVNILFIIHIYLIKIV